MPAQFTILASGSSGNCAYLESGETRLLIDAGLSGKQVRQRLAEIGRAPEGLHGILITHEHSDHVQGLQILASKLRIPIFCNRLTKEAIEAQFECTFDCRIFETGSSFEVGDIAVDTFSIPHDAYDPVGFVLHTSGGQIGFLTDLGHATKLVIERVKQARLLVLETNHDMKLLQEDTKRPWSIKQRIMSRHGHLSNVAAADALEQILSETLEHLYLGHLSRDCNRPELAKEVIVEKLTKCGSTKIVVHSTSQDFACPTLTIHEPTL